MNTLDAIVLIWLVFAGFRGFKKGLIIEIASLLALILGVYGALNFSGYTSGFIGEHWDIPQAYVAIVSFVVTFLIILIAVLVVGKVLEGFVNLIAMKFINKLLGLIFGMVRAIVVLAFIIYIFDAVDANASIYEREKRNESYVYFPLRNAGKMIADSLANEQWKSQLEKITNYNVPQPTQS